LSYNLKIPYSSHAQNRTQNVQFISALFIGRHPKYNCFPKCRST